MSKVRNTLAFLALGVGLHTSLAQADETITIAYQTGFSPFVRAVASGEIEKIPGVQVEFRQFNSGAEIRRHRVRRRADRRCRLRPAASTSKGIDVKVIYISVPPARTRRWSPETAAASRN